MQQQLQAQPQQQEIFNYKTTDLVAENLKSSALSSEHLNTLLPTTSSSCSGSSSSNTLKTETTAAVPAAVAKVSSYNDLMVKDLPLPHNENSCSSTASPTSTHYTKNHSNSLAKQLERRFNAGPLIRANFRRCHKKLANLHLHHHNNKQQQQQQQHLDHPKKDSKLLSSFSTLELYNQDCDHIMQLDQKPLMKNMQKTSDTLPGCYMEKSSNKKSPEKCAAAGLRQARRRKRLSFMRRSTKSAPG